MRRTVPIIYWKLIRHSKAQEEDRNPRCITSVRVESVELLATHHIAQAAKTEPTFFDVMKFEGSILTI